MQRCLIVEGSPIIRRVTKVILTDFGFEVVEASTGREGLTMFQRHIPRLTIVDSTLRDMAALDVIRLMRDAMTERVQILYCTTDYDIKLVRAATDAGASDLLIKPFDRVSLAAKLDTWQLPDKPALRDTFYARLSRSEIVRIA